MLAQNFKTPMDLGLSDPEFDALFKVLGMLERGEIEPEQFNMSRWCGTICCIIGHARNLDARAFSGPILDRDVALRQLFGAGTVGRRKIGLSDIAPTQAAIALRNYLTHGEARWDEALAG